MTVVEFNASGKNDDYCKSDAGKTEFSQGQTSVGTSVENPEGYTACMQALAKKNDNDPIPVVIQFTFNHDGTFQYAANSAGLSATDLFNIIYN